MLWTKQVIITKMSLNRWIKFYWLTMGLSAPSLLFLMNYSNWELTQKRSNRTFKNLAKELCKCFQTWSLTRPSWRWKVSRWTPNRFRFSASTSSSIKTTKPGFWRSTIIHLWTSTTTQKRKITRRVPAAQKGRERAIIGGRRASGVPCWPARKDNCDEWHSRVHSDEEKWVLVCGISVQLFE